LKVVDKIAYFAFVLPLFRKFLPSFPKSVMIKIRLQRHGARHAPFYRMVVAPSTVRRDGRFLEVLGTYNPQAHARTEELKLKMDRIDHWLEVGAQPTDTAKSLIRQGRLSPEEWLERVEKKAATKLARVKNKKSDAPVMKESPAEESEAKSEEPAEAEEAEAVEESPTEEPAVEEESSAEESEAKSEEPAEAEEAEAVEESPTEEPAAEEESPAEEAEAKSEEDSGEEGKEEDTKGS
jgi:small subunit ribosomal protein S16